MFSIDRHSNIDERTDHLLPVDEARHQQMTREVFRQPQLGGALHWIVRQPRVAHEQRENEDQIVGVHGAGHCAILRKFPLGGQNRQVAAHENPLSLCFHAFPQPTLDKLDPRSSQAGFIGQLCVEKLSQYGVDSGALSLHAPILARTTDKRHRRRQPMITHALQHAASHRSAPRRLSRDVCRRGLPFEFVKQCATSSVARYGPAELRCGLAIGGGAEDLSYGPRDPWRGCAARYRNSSASGRDPGGVVRLIAAMMENDERQPRRERFDDGAVATMCDDETGLAEHLAVRGRVDHGDIRRCSNRVGPDCGPGCHQASHGKAPQRIHDPLQARHMILERRGHGDQDQRLVARGWGPGLVRRPRRVVQDRTHALEAALPPKTDGHDSPRWLIGHYRERAAVASGDPDEVIASFGELTHSHRLHDLAKALVEVGDIDEAIEYAERATLLETGWQAEQAGQYWCELLHEEWPHEDELAARQLVFDRWPSSQNALSLARGADDENSDVTWSSLAEAVFARLETQPPRELINTLLGVGLADRAWEAAQRLTTDAGLWTMLVAAREKADPASVIPVLLQLIQSDLQVAKPQNYKSAVRRLKQLRIALKATDAAPLFPRIVADLREQHRRRPTLIRAFDRAGF